MWGGVRGEGSEEREFRGWCLDERRVLLSVVFFFFKQKTAYEIGQ